MAVTLPQSLAIPLATIRRERILPAQGEVTVRPGQKVEPMDVVARVSRPRGYRSINVARRLNVRPDEVAEIAQVNPGDPVKKGDRLTKGKGGFLGGGRKYIKSPVDGVVAAVGNGRMVIEVAPEIIELRALVRGSVISAMAGYGVVIETYGGFVQAAWGSGKEAYGVIKVVTPMPGDPLTGDAIDVSCRGAVLIGGGTIEESAIKQAVQMQARGLVAGSIPARLARKSFDLPFPIVVTEGIGKIPMADAIFSLLRSNEGRECAVDGRTPGTVDGGRPDIIIPLPVNSPPPPLPGHSTPLQVGAKVRALRAPYLGAVGEVKVLHEHARPLPTGAYLSGAEVDLEGHGVVFVPFANLEWVG